MCTTRLLSLGYLLTLGAVSLFAASSSRAQTGDGGAPSSDASGRPEPTWPRVFEKDGDTVILELVNRGTSVTGKPYENEYCFVFELGGGRIRAISEYVDLDKAKIAVSG